MQKKMTTWLSINLLILSMFTLGCGKNKTEEVAQPNHITGNWKFANLSTQLPNNSLELLPLLINNPTYELTWIVTPLDLKTSKAILQFSHLPSNGSASCTLSIEYNNRYCCPEMRVIYLDKNPVLREEAPSGCIHSLFNKSISDFAAQLIKEMGEDFHFTHHKDFIKLEGPYIDSMTTIELRPI